MREHLSSVGEPAQIVLPVDRETGRPRGFAFVDYADRAVAEEAISRFNQQPFKGRPLAVSEARPREERPGRRAAARRLQFGPPAGPAGRRAASPRARAAGHRARDGGSGAPAGPRSRNFGPDAPPKNKRKPPRKDATEGPKGPIKERPVSRLYENDEDWRNEKPRRPTSTTSRPARKQSRKAIRTTSKRIAAGEQSCTRT